MADKNQLAKSLIAAFPPETLKQIAELDKAKRLLDSMSRAAFGGYFFSDAELDAIHPMEHQAKTTKSLAEAAAILGYKSTGSLYKNRALDGHISNGRVDTDAIEIAKQQRKPGRARSSAKLKAAKNIAKFRRSLD